MEKAMTFPTEGVELRPLLVVSDYARSLAFYRDVLGATVVREFPGTLCFLNVAGSQILLTVPGGPTQDKPTVTFASPTDPDWVTSSLVIRVPDCWALKPETRKAVERRNGRKCIMMRICVAVLRGSAVLGWVLGILFLRGNADSFVPSQLAMVLGVLMALALWGAGLLVGTKGGSPELMISAFVLGLIGMVFAFNQETLLAGSLHWIIQVVHVLLAMSMVILAIPIARHYNAAQASQVTSRSMLERQADSK